MNEEQEEKKETPVIDKVLVVSLTIVLLVVITFVLIWGGK
jgi:hypothetical protein